MIFIQNYYYNHYRSSRLCVSRYNSFCAELKDQEPYNQLIEHLGQNQTYLMIHIDITGYLDLK